ncbi:MAG: ATP-binding cassette domain-containing protein [Clostridia bacterium]|nr:ATP-binding cassette domain-containing protein [Clostridia bacterium]NCC75831.1 ATP-binding cassette domain-containing protein [Clostridia bacterium]
MTKTILEMRMITKTFPGVKALSDVSFEIKSDEIHALVGENGAGKSTLMKVLSGVYPHGTYDGQILYEGEECQFRDIKQSEEKGIVIIHQELALVPYLSIAENIFLGNETARGGIINWNTTIAKTRQLLQKVGLDENPNTLIKDIGVGKQQLVEIAKALSKDVKVLILDEPTAALNETDSDNLLKLLLELKKQGISSVLISHKLNEVVKVANVITIIRDGAVIETLDVQKDDISEDRIIRGMVGRDMTHRFPARTPKIGEVIFEVQDWTAYHPLNEERKISDQVAIKVRAGEIVGIAGLMGAGRTELAMGIFGHSYGKRISGKVFKNGQKIDTSSVDKAIKHGIAYVSEDRKNYGLVLANDIKFNVTLANLEDVSKGGVLDDNKEISVAHEYCKRFSIKTPGIFQKTVNLSGGNQQKVVLSKWIFSQPDVLILDEPTRGIDVGAKYEIYGIINELAAAGKAVIFISSEMPEILGMCDRIYVMDEGRMCAELNREEASQEIIMKAILSSRGRAS